MEKNAENITEINENFSELISLIAETNDKEFLNDFFDCLFSQAERKDFAERWLLVKKIDEGVSQRVIARQYGLSLCKITRGSKELKKENSAFRKMLDIYKNRKS